MIIFWIVMVMMILVALSFIALPLLWPQQWVAPDRTALSVVLYKDRLQRLDQQKQAEEITADEYGLMRLELEKSLLDEIPPTPANKARPQANSKWLAIILLLAVPVAALLFYMTSGTYQSWVSYHSGQEKTATINAEIASLGSLENIIAKLRQRVQENPDGRGWFLLGRLYMKEEHFPEAVQAFAQAEQLTPDQPEIQVAYAEALYFANGRSLNPQARALLTTALKQHPSQPAAINLLAVAAFQRGNYQQAADYWQQLLAQYPLDSDEGKVLLRMIGEAQQHIKPPLQFPTLKKGG